MNWSSEPLEPFSVEKTTKYRSFYNLRILGYVDLACSVITVISNVFIIAIFTRKRMITPANTILTHMTITESLTSIFYSPRAWQELIRVTECAIVQHRTYTWEKISLHSYQVTFLFRQTGVWMAVMLAVWRYIAIVHPLKERHWCNMQITRRFITAGYIFGTFLASLAYFGWECAAANQFLDENGCVMTNNTDGMNKTTIYRFQIRFEDNPVPFIMGTIFYGGVKLLPSVAFAIISYRLINALKQARNRRRHMTGSPNSDVACNLKKDRQTDRTTKMIVIIAALFIIGEVPHGIASLFVAFGGPELFWEYYYYWQEIVHCYSHISRSLNFVICYTMSHQFRKSFRDLFRRTRNINKDLVNNITSAQRLVLALLNPIHAQKNSDQTSSIAVIENTFITQTQDE